MRRFVAVASFLLLVPLALVPASGKTDPSWVAPRSASGRKNPLESRPELVAGGRKVYEQRCAYCHGDDLRGTNRAPDLRTARVQGQSDGELLWKITSGNTHTGMPTFSFLPEAQRWQLVLHLRAAH
jgi:mono/diheme cytochrome c family protein